MNSTNPDLLIEDTKRITDKFSKIKESLGNRSGPNVIWLNEKISDRQLALPDEFDPTSMPTMSRLLNDFEKGIAVFAGHPNAGKSTLLTNMMLQGLANNNDLVVVDISLDDPPDKRYQQYIASLSGLYYQEITTNTTLSPERKERRDKADELFHRYIEEQRLIPLESSEEILKDDKTQQVEVRNFYTVFNQMKALRSKFPDKKIAMFIDSWNDLDLNSAQSNDNELTRSEGFLVKLRDYANKYGIMVFLSAHIRKSSSSEIDLEDIKGTKSMEYICVFGAIVRNEYKERNLENPLLYTENRTGKTFPILTVLPMKTKVSAWEWPVFYPIKSGQCQILTLTPDEYNETKRFYYSKRT